MGRTERGLDVSEHDHAAVCAPTLVRVEGETNRVVERQTQRLVHFLSTLGAVEEVLLDVLQDREPGAASFVRRSVLAIGTSNTSSEGSACTRERNQKG